MGQVRVRSFNFIHAQLKFPVLKRILYFKSVPANVFPPETTPPPAPPPQRAWEAAPAGTVLDISEGLLGLMLAKLRPGGLANRFLTLPLTLTPTLTLICLLPPVSFSLTIEGEGGRPNQKTHSIEFRLVNPSVYVGS